MAFDASVLRAKLDEPGFMKPGLCLFADNAYVNKTYLATPYPNINPDNSEEERQKDAYNYFHSNTRITIECTFGILIQRWGLLRRKAPKGYPIAKVIATFVCLCKLHNFLIDQQHSNETNEDVPEHTAADRFHMQMSGSIPFEQTAEVK